MGRDIPPERGNFPTDPERAQRIDTDPERFIAISGRLDQSEDLSTLLEETYFRPAGEGEMLTVVDYAAFLEQSRYMQKQ